MSPAAVLDAIHHGHITIAPIDYKNSFGVDLWALKCKDQDFYVTLEDAHCSGYKKEWANMRVAANAHTQDMFDAIGQLPAYIELCADHTSPIDTNSYFDGSFIKIHYREEDDICMDSTGEQVR